MSSTATADVDMLVDGQDELRSRSRSGIVEVGGQVELRSDPELWEEAGGDDICMSYGCAVRVSKETLHASGWRLDVG